MLHGKDHVCMHCPDARMSVVDEARELVKLNELHTKTGRVASRFLALMTAVGKMQTVKDQEDLLSRLDVPLQADQIQGSLGQLQEELRSIFMSMSSCCTEEFGPDKCTKVGDED